MSTHDDAHDLLPGHIRATLPNLYENEHLGMQAKALVKISDPTGEWIWFASEFDGEDLLFGLVVGFEIELEYFSLSELEELQTELGLGIARDLDFEPKTLRELREEYQAKR